MIKTIAWYIFDLLIVAVVVVVVGGLVLSTTGGPSGATECDVRPADVTPAPTPRAVQNTREHSDAWDAKWDPFDAQLDAGQDGAVTFDENQATSRASVFLKARNAPVDDLIICFHDCLGTAKATVDLPIISEIPELGNVFDTRVEITGTMDFSGDHPTLVIDEFEAGNLPGFASDELKSRVEDIVNDRLDELDLEHDYQIAFSEGSVEINGQP